jgi:hypothetical protein
MAGVRDSERDLTLASLKSPHHGLIQISKEKRKLLLREPPNSSLRAQIISKPRHNACRLQFADGHAVNDASVPMPVLCTTICQLDLYLPISVMKVP